jgi:hypothetical protein
MPLSGIEEKPMRRTIFLLVIVSGLVPLTEVAAQWKPAKGPLASRWAKEVTADRVLPEYPRPQLVRKDWLNLNGVWQLAFGKDGDSLPTGTDLAERILVPFPVESALSGVMKRADQLWYRRTFAVPKEWAGQRVLLHFGAVDWEATVYVNGLKLGTHRGGYDAFSFDITDLLKPNADQELIVHVKDPTDGGTQPRGKQVNKPGGIYYTPTTGIWQTVWLEPVPAVSIAGLKIVPDIDTGMVRVTVQGRGAKGSEKVSLEAREGQQVVAAGEGEVDKPIDLRITGKLKLWSPDTPFLYDLSAKLSGDTVTSYFGMRKISIGKDGKGVNRLLLNGQPVFQIGLLDQGFWPDGLYTAPTDEALHFDIEMHKKLGFNLSRKHVKVEPQRWYYWCDKLGLLVWQDMPSGDKGVGPGKGQITRTPESAKQFELELQRMLDGLHNHPSIVMWVVFNEGWGQFDTPRMTLWTKRHDPTRLVNCASGWNDMKVGDVHDLHSYPGPSAPPLEEERAGVLGEFGGLGLGVDGHTWTDRTWGYQGTASKDDLTRRYEQLLKKVWTLKEQKGLNAAVYTQLTDVETEANGLLTYDREVVKVDAERVAAVNRGDLSKMAQFHEVVPTSEEKAQTWRYTFEKPADSWSQADFDDSGWKEGPGGFGTRGTPGGVVRTEWKTSDIWIRRTIELPQGPLAGLYLRIHHDEDAEVYLNGVLAARVRGFVTDYLEVPIRAEARATLKPGKNRLAVHCKQTAGGQYIDVGLVDLRDSK